jgi:hypothetical protein
MPNTFTLYQNFPNPFNPKTNIKYQIAKSSHVKLIVYDILGKEIETLVNSYQRQGNYSVIFNGNNLPSGVYFYVLQADNFIKFKKMVLLK